MGLRLERSRVVLFAMALVVLVIVGSLAGMDPGLRRSVVDLFGYGGPHSDESSGSRELFHSGVPIQGRKNGETYGEYDKRRHSRSVGGFRGFGCPSDCGRHEAGYRWAEERRLPTPRDCRGPSWEFVEGCAAYLMEAEAS